ncbi:MAG: MoaD/ThiS family protein [Clostridiales bacterium]|nr:MoaD/ThiS family protein [Clostridiales bacterium]
MQISVRLMCADLEVPAGSREISVADNSTIAQALDAYVKLHPIDDPDNVLPASMFMIGKNPAQLHSVLKDGDELMVMRILHGG